MLLWGQLWLHLKGYDMTNTEEFKTVEAATKRLETMVRYSEEAREEIAKIVGANNVNQFWQIGSLSINIETGRMAKAIQESLWYRAEGFKQSGTNQCWAEVVAEVCQNQADKIKEDIFEGFYDGQSTNALSNGFDQAIKDAARVMSKALDYMAQAINIELAHTELAAR